jgi:NAD(P)-dependent dehydrogenase (short-subunit alcohol dehydrogenase family)
MEISDKTAIVTGGASGLGEATAKTLYAAGANVMIVDMNEEKGKAVVAGLGDRAAFELVDVTNTDQVQASVQATMDRFKAIHILINCAGTGDAVKTVGKDGPHDLDRFKRIININLIGTFDFIRQAAFHMQDNEPNEDGERGVIVNTASVAFQDGQIGQAAYSASKAGVVGMTLTIARDMGRSGIRCCTIAPGLFETGLTAFMPQPMKEALRTAAPFPYRFGWPNEYAMLARQIVENSMLNGETIRLDGAIRMPPR